MTTNSHIKKFLWKIMARLYFGGGDYEKKFLNERLAEGKLNSRWIRPFPPIEALNLYSSHLPDRYTGYLDIHNEDRASFFNYSDLEKWVHGNYANNAGDIGRFIFLNQCFELLLKDGIVGHVAELGVYKGNSAALLARFARRIGKTCFLLDTFEGFDPRDLRGVDVSVAAEHFKDTSLEAVRDLVGGENTEFIQGYFPESASGWEPDGEFALVHIDCDLELPIRAALEFFYHRVAQGGFIIIHDYSSLSWPGATKAVDEFFQYKPECVIPIPDKSGTCAIRKIH
jgi:hypothetical protein